jgi:hypothetical protein
MKTLAQYACVVAAIGGVLLVAGCATTDTTRMSNHFASSRQIGPTSEFTVIENSFGRELTAQEMGQLREGVAKYLESQGVARSGEYYVRVDFNPAKPDGPGDWVVVKVTNLPASTYTLIAAYQAMGPDDYYPSTFAYDQGYGYGYGDFSYGFYDPPVFYPTNYHPRPFPGTTRHRDDNGKPGDHRKGDKDDHPRGTDHRPDNTHYTPRPGDNAGGTGRWNHPPRTPDSGGARDHGPGGSSPPRPESTGSSHSSPAPAPSYSAPAPVQSATANRNDPAADRQQQSR